MKRIEKVQFIMLLNSLGLMVVCMVLALAFYFQLALHEVPCPLCLLQRAGLILSGFGFYFNLRLGFRYSHYALIIMASLLTAVVAARQILLHIMPGDPGYSSVFLGFHFYTWSLITMIAMIMLVSGIMLLSDLSDEIYVPYFLRKTNKKVTKTVCVLFDILVVACFLLTFLECGFSKCPDNPVTYKYILK